MRVWVRVCAAAPRAGTPPPPPLPAAAALRLGAGIAHSPRSLPPGGAGRAPRLRSAAASALRQLCGVVLPSAAGGESGPGARGQCARARARTGRVAGRTAGGDHCGGGGWWGAPLSRSPQARTSGRGGSARRRRRDRD